MHERERCHVRGERARERGVRVALHDHGREGRAPALGGEQRLEPDGRVGDLAAAGAAADGEPVIGRREADPGLEGGGHLGVVVLAGVDEHGVAAEQGDDAPQLHGLRTGAVHDGDPGPPGCSCATPVPSHVRVLGAYRTGGRGDLRIAGVAGHCRSFIGRPAPADRGSGRSHVADSTKAG